LLISGTLMNEKKEIIQKSGVVVEALPNTHFKVILDEGGEVMAHLAGRLRVYRIRILPGDKVTVEMSSPSDTRGRIVYRRK
jgi:translation initiation factor IF-1